MPKDFNITVGDRIRRIREQNNLTRDALAEKAGISPQFLASVEIGAKGISAKTLLNLARALHVTADFILTGAEVSDSTRLTIEALLSLPSGDRILTEKIVRSIIHTTSESTEG